MAKEKETPVNKQNVTQTAKGIYVGLLNGPRRAYDKTVLAKEAFCAAEAFEAVADRYDAGELFAKSMEPVSRDVIVTLWDDNAGGIAGSPMGKPLLDEKTRKPITEIQPGDPHAYAKNLPEGHPINQRFINEEVRKELGWGPPKYADAN